MFVISSVTNDPKKGEGWEGFLDDEDDTWYAAFETKEVDGEEVIDVGAYEGFDNLQEVVNFVMGTGTYEDTRSFTPCQSDLVDKKREMKNSVWKLPSKLEEIESYLEQGAMRGEVDIDPEARAQWSVSEEEARMDGKDTKYVASFIVYDPDYEEQEGEATEYFYLETHWYDEEPEKVNLEDVFDLGSIRTDYDTS